MKTPQKTSIAGLPSANINEGKLKGTWYKDENGWFRPSSVQVGGKNYINAQRNPNAIQILESGSSVPPVFTPMFYPDGRVYTPPRKIQTTDYKDIVDISEDVAKDLFNRSDIETDLQEEQDRVETEFNEVNDNSFSNLYGTWENTSGDPSNPQFEHRAGVLSNIDKELSEKELLDIIENKNNIYTKQEIKEAKTRYDALLGLKMQENIYTGQGTTLIGAPMFKYDDLLKINDETVLKALEEKSKIDYANKYNILKKDVPTGIPMYLSLIHI